MTTRCGFVTVLGAPNAGKSTLINLLVGTKVSIVSPKAQTTRTLVRGIALHEQSQIIFIDTPGIFTPQQRLEKAMVAAAWQGREEADVIVLLVDATKKKPGADTMKIVNELKSAEEKRPRILVLNKVDKAAKENLLALAQKLNNEVPFAATFMISAQTGDGTKDLLAYLAKELPESPWHFPEDQVSDMPMKLLAAEITREKLFRQLHEELPYALTVETEEWEDFDNGSLRIGQMITVMRDTHKAIVLGKGGAQIKEIGEMARVELEGILERRVHLKLFVRVQQGWHDDPEKYRIWGLDYSA